LRLGHAGDQFGVAVQEDEYVCLRSIPSLLVRAGAARCRCEPHLRGVIPCLR
jgi:hypothetical protein